MSACRSIAALLAAVVSVAVLSGCSGSDSTGDGNGEGSAAAPTSAATARGGSAPADGDTAAEVPPNPSLGCGRPQPKQGTNTFRYRGTRRPFLLALPSDYNGSDARPLILNFHGLGSNSVEQSAYSRLPSAGPQKGFIVVTPDTAPGRNGWKLPGMPNGNADIRFVDAFLDHLEKKLCVDRSREFAGGMSNGAGLSAALVCGLNGRLAGVAPIAGLNLTFPCASAKPTTIIAFHGTGDKIVPYKGGPPFEGKTEKVPGWMRPKNGKINLPSVEWAIAAWARNFGCGPAKDGVGSTEVRLRRYTDCKNGAIVQLYTVNDGGHTWPGSLAIKELGKTTSLIDATALTLEAFTDHPARR